MLFFRSFSKTSIIVFLGFTIIACSQTLYVPTAESVQNDELLQELSEGRKLYIQHCGGCHNLYKPEKFSAQHWAHEMEEMKVEAKISDVQAALIMKYLTGYNTSDSES